jgi:hypothetical protein
VKDGRVSIVCEYSSDFIIKYRDSIISQDKRDKFELHLLNCETCRRKLALDKEFIDFLKTENSTAKNFNKVQVMSNIDLNKYNSGKGKFMAKLIKWKSISIKFAAIAVICIGGISMTHISPVREGFKTLSLSILNKQSRLNDNFSTGSGSDTIQVSTPKPSAPVISSNGILPNYVDFDKLPDNYTLEDAKTDGCVVFEGSFLTSGEKEWDNFIEITQNSQSAKIRIVNQSEYDNSDLYMRDLLFDGTTYYTVNKNGAIGQFKYLNHYPSETSDKYVLVNKKDVLLEQLSITKSITENDHIYSNHYCMPNIDIKGIWPNYVSLNELPVDYTLEDAKTDGCVVFQDCSLISGEPEWKAFVETTRKGQPTTIRIVACFSEDFNTNLYIEDLLFDGSNYYVLEKDSIVEQYKYLNHYPSETADQYILVDIKDISHDQLFRSLASSDINDHIRQKIIYYNNLK